MIPREPLEEVLKRHLKGVLPQHEVHDLVNDIEQLENDWEEVKVSHREMGYSMSVNCPDICWLADQVFNGAEIKLYRRKKPA